MEAPTKSTVDQKAEPRRIAYSADIKLYLILESGERLSLGQVCHEFVDLKEPRLLRGGPATVELRVEGEPTRWNVTLGASVGVERRVPVKIA
jgi:hypothetical protein